MSYVLAIDYGTSYTCAAISADGRTEVLRFESDSRLPSHVFLEDDGQLSVGKSAGNGAARAPERFERSPKRDLGFSGLLLGDRITDPRDAVAAVLSEVLAVARRHENGRDPSEVRLTHPAAWGPKRREALMEAAARAGITAPVQVSEPEAAVHHFANSPRVAIAPGDLIAVYDLGGGTFDTAVLRCSAPDTFELAGPPGGTAGSHEGSAEIGGDVFDHRVFEYFGRQIEARDPAAWAAIRKPQDRRDRQAQRMLRNDAREAKENLSSTTSASVWVERIGEDLLITRDQFNEMIADEVRQSIAILDETLSAAGTGLDTLSALFLTGGSSRIPLVEESVRGHFGRADMQDDPKTVVALGAARMQAPAAQALEIDVQRTEVLSSGRQGGQQLTLYRVFAHDAQGKPMDEELRSFEALAGQEVVTAEAFVENGHRTHWMLSRSGEPRQATVEVPGPPRDDERPAPEPPPPRPPRPPGPPGRWAGIAAIAGGVLMPVGAQIADPFGGQFTFVDLPLIILALACIGLGIARVRGRDVAAGALALLGATVLAYVAATWHGPHGLPWHALIDAGAALVLVAGVLELRSYLGATRGSAPPKPLVLATAFAGTVVFLAGSFLAFEASNSDGAQPNFWEGIATLSILLVAAGVLALLAAGAVALRAGDARARIAAALGACLIAGTGLSSTQILGIRVQVGSYNALEPGVWFTALGGAIALAGAILLLRGRDAAT